MENSEKFIDSSSGVNHPIQNEPETSLGIINEDTSKVKESLNFRFTNYTLSDSNSAVHRASSDIAMKAYFTYFRNLEPGHSRLVDDVKRAFSSFTGKAEKISMRDFKDTLSPALGTVLMYEVKAKGKALNFKESHEVFIDTIRNLSELELRCPLCSSFIDLSEGPASNDHVVPASSGGIILPGNSVAMCLNCNSKKSDRPLEDFAYDVLGSLSPESYLSLEDVKNFKKSMRDYAKELFSMTQEEYSCLFDVPYEGLSRSLKATIASSKSARHSHLTAKDFLVGRAPKEIQDILSTFYSKDEKYKWLPKEIIEKIKALPSTYSEIRVVSAFDSIFQEATSLEDMLSKDWTLSQIESVKTYREENLNSNGRTNPLNAVSAIISDLANERDLPRPALSVLESYKISAYVDNYQFWLDNEDLDLYLKFSPEKISEKLESYQKGSITSNRLYSLIFQGELLPLIVRFSFSTKSEERESIFVEKAIKIIRNYLSEGLSTKLTRADAKRFLIILLELSEPGSDYSYIDSDY